MVRRPRFYLLGAAALGALGTLAGCAGHNMFAEREPWRHEAEVECMNSGAVKEGPGKVRISPIEGPGVCGADFPLKVSSLGDSVPMGYDDEPRPPGAVPGALGAGAPGQVPPRWPIVQPRPAASAVTRDDLPGPNGGSRFLSDRPMSLNPASQRAGASPEPYDFRKPYRAAATPQASDPSSPYDFSPEPYDRRQVIGAPRPAPRPAPSPPPMLGPASAPPVTVASGPVAVSPAATLACPLVSVLDQWITEAVQPAAMKWFGVPVVEIKQISAYSCRGMNGDPNAHISEHAFGNALDIAAFTLADGRHVSVKDGWRGLPEEQGFLRDVEAGACQQFTTVLAPGSNVYHYDHIHVDLMRRATRRLICQPAAVSGEEVAARAMQRNPYASREQSVTGSLGVHKTASVHKHNDKINEEDEFEDE